MYVGEAFGKLSDHSAAISLLREKFYSPLSPEEVEAIREIFDMIL